MDISGYWSIRLAGSTGYSLNEVDGTAEFKREPGDYAVWLYSHQGNWGIEGRRDGLNVQLIPISIQSGRVIEIVISLARLEVGLISRDGNAMVDEYVNAYSPSYDVAGNQMLGDGIAWERTDSRGIASLVLPSGNYILEWASSFPYQCMYFNVSVQPGESRREVYTISNEGECRH